MATATIIFNILFWINCISGEYELDIANGDTSDFYLMTCASTYCSNTTTFTFNQHKTCNNPLLTVHFRLTDFTDVKLQYLSITINQQELGKCTGPNQAEFNAKYNETSIPLYTDCLNGFSIAELIGYNPTEITLKLSISPHVTNVDRAYLNNLLYALVAFGCSEGQTNQITSQEWNPSSPIPAHSPLQCIQSGCQATAHFTVLNPEQCRVPLLSVQFWMTDFDQNYEYLTVEVNGEYLGICEGGKQMEIPAQLLTNKEEDTYWNNYSYWCFREIDISRYTGIEPEEIEISLILQETVDRNWLDATPTPYLLDGIVTMHCGEQTQDDIVPDTMTYDRKTTSHNYPYPHEISIKCQEVECGAVWTWNVLGHCEYPILSLYYFAEHYEDSMVEIRINERLFGHCGPTMDTGNVTLETQYGIRDVRTCFEKLEFHELLRNWNSRSDFNGNPNAISNKFQFGFALTEIDELDGISNGSVAHLFINLDCKTETEIENSQSIAITDQITTTDGFPYSEAELNCVYAGCSTKITYHLDVPFNECEVPKLDLWFWLTDFGIQTEFISVTINGHLFGWCDGGQDHDFSSIYQCLNHADIEEWADWDVNGNKLELVLNASSHVDGLDANKDGFLVNAKAKLTCYDATHDNKLKSIEIFPDDNNLNEVSLPVECQGVGCYTYSQFHIRNHICYQPKLSVQFWLSDFQTFDEYVSVEINDNELQKCRGGADEDFDIISTCFEHKDIRYILDNYPYNTEDESNDFEQYYIAIGDVLNVTLQMSQDSVWLDHSYNYSLLQGSVSLECSMDNIAVIHETNSSIIPGNNDDISDSDNATFRYITLTVNIQKVSSDVILKYFEELQSRFEYALDATIHFEDDSHDRIAFTLQSRVDIIDAKQVSDFIVYITTLSHEYAKELKRILEMDIFLFIFQETLRDSHFKDSLLESITNLQILSDIPGAGHNDIQTPLTTAANSNKIDTTESENKADTPETTLKKSEENFNFFKILFTSASATDWLSFIGVLVLSILLCVCCIGGIAMLCVYQQRNKTRKEIQKYKQTKDGDSDTDIEEMAGMIDHSNNNNGNEVSILSHKSQSIKSFLSKNSNKNSKKKLDEMSEKMAMINRANELKDNVHRHHSQSGSLIKHKIKPKKHSKYTTVNNQIPISNNEIQMSDNMQSKSTAIHPALSTAIETVNKMNNLKSERIAATHGLMVNSAIIEASSDSSESMPSGIDLSEEFVTINDDIEVSISVQDIEDMNAIKRKQHKRGKSKSKNKRNKKFKARKYQSIQQIEDNKVFGVRKGHTYNVTESITNMKHSKMNFSDGLSSDDLSDLSDSGLREQSLNSITQDFSQMI